MLEAGGKEAATAFLSAMSRRKKWSIRAFLTLLVVGLIRMVMPQIPAMFSHSPQPDLLYFTNEVSAYPVAYRDGKPSLADIQARPLLDGPIKIVSVVMQNQGERSATDVTARIIVPTSDDYLGGWITKSQEPSRPEMLGGRTEWTSPKLIPGDSVKIDFYLRRANSAYQIRVFDGDGRNANHYPYVPVHDGGDDMVIVPHRKRWILGGGAGLMLAGVLLGLAWMNRKRPEEPVLSADAPGPADASGLPAGSPTSMADDRKSRDRPPKHWTAGGQ